MNEFIGLDASVKRVTLALAVAALVQSGSALAVLELRDINGNATANSTLAEFAYDTVLDATWYLTANNTGLSWDDAKAWASGLTVGTFSGWSLPSADPVCGFNFNCTNSQMGELYYTALGNPEGGPLLNAGPFKNLQSVVYWSGTEYAPVPTGAWGFNTGDGGQTAGDKLGVLYALAVRPGDVAAVPEASSWAMLLVGLAAVGVVGARRPR